MATDITCSFCGADHNKAKVLITGRDGVICEACVELVRQYTHPAPPPKLPAPKTAKIISLKNRNVGG